MKEICKECRQWERVKHGRHYCTYWMFVIHSGVCSSGYRWRVASEVSKLELDDIDSNYIHPPVPGDFGCNRWEEKWKGPFGYFKGVLGFRRKNGQWEESVKEKEDLCNWLNELWHSNRS